MNVRRFGRLMTAMTALALLISVLPGTAHAQWPPFNFRMRYAYADGRITYVIRMSGLGTLRLSDVAIKIPLPEGTRYVEGGAVFPGTSVSFDGAEVTCFTPTFHNIQDVRLPACACTHADRPTDADE